MSVICSGIGIGVTRTIALGRACLMQNRGTETTPGWISKAEVGAEVERFKQAVAEARRQLQSVRRQIPDSTPADIASFVDTHLLMLEDPALLEAPIELIEQHHCSAEWALQIRRDELVNLFDEMDDPYLRTRKDDVVHVANQIQDYLAPIRRRDYEKKANLRDCVVLAQDLTPADMIMFRHHGIAAFVTEFGGPMSHTAILARSLDIPAVVGVRAATRILQHGELLAVDSGRGMVLAGLEEPELSWFRKRRRAERAHITYLRRLVDQPAITRDGHAVSLLANIELPDDIQATCSNGADGVGLYRTEFLYMNRDTVPDEEEHLDTYRDVLDGLGGIPLTIRTLDLGADKQVDGGTPGQEQPACNPALGLRAIRLCLKEPELFKPQLRAILRSSAHGPVRLMIPMISSLPEWLQVKSMIEETKADLRRQRLPFDPEIPVGAMIEVPAAALSSHSLARHLDFLSLGTNDLIQYTLAIDRVDDEVNYLFDPVHPAVLRLIQLTIEAARSANIPVSMCGEMAGDPRYIRLLLGMGLRQFSMQPGGLLEAKKMIRSSDISRISPLCAQLLETSDAEGIQFLLQKINS
jgi:phosphotransferase system enzyme I (PtsI)